MFSLENCGILCYEVAYLTYAHRNVIAAMVDGRELPASPHKLCK